MDQLGVLVGKEEGERFEDLSEMLGGPVLRIVQKWRHGRGQKERRKKQRERSGKKGKD